MVRNIKELVKQMTLEEKAGMCSGLDFWHLKGVERLGIPSVQVSDGPHGLRKQDEQADHLGINESIKAVCFPPAVLSACSFDRALMEKLGDAIGKEAQANNLAVVLGPGVNIKRSPICGRNFEYYSEDPYLSGETAAAYIKGVQAHHVGTSIKHFAANNQETQRVSSSSNVDERTLREIYLPAFETAVKQAQPYTVMCSYNRLNGTYTSEHPWLLSEILRKEWGFDGFVMSDWGAVNDRVKGLFAGLDLEMPSSNGLNDAEIVEAVKKGNLKEEILDSTVERILRIVFEYYDNREEQEFTLEEDHELAKQIAEESMVLLKNENIFPLNAQEQILIVGEFASKPRFQGGGSSHVNCFKASSFLNAVAENENIKYVKGFSSEGDEYDEELAREAIQAAENADKVVIFAGLPESFESEGYDRPHMKLPKCQDRLIQEILEVQPETAVVLHNGSPVEMPWKEKVKGILEAYLGGQAGGEATANILFGKVNPSGKLAETFPIKLSDNPSLLTFGELRDVDYREGVYVGYRYYDIKEMSVAFPFGHGLSYTTFLYDNIQVDKNESTDKDVIHISVDITNTGEMAGKEIIQLYVSDMTGVTRRPPKELKGFEKIFLNPGEKKKVTFTLDNRSFAWYSTQIHDWYAASGEYVIGVGASSQDIRQIVSVHRTTTRQLPLEINLNSTVGQLYSDPRTLELGKEVKKRLDQFFGVESTENENEAVTDKMKEEQAGSVPLRNLVMMGLYSKEEMFEKIESVNRRVEGIC